MKKIIFLVTIALLYACSSSSDDSADIDTSANPGEQVLTFSEYLNLLNTNDTQGSIMIQSQGSSNDFYAEIQSSLKKSTVPLNFELNGEIKTSTQNTSGSDKFSWNTSPTNMDMFLKPIYGKKLKATLSNKTVIFDTNTTDTNFSMPALLDVNINGGDIVKTGTVISWNKDPNNLKGVLVLAEYTPSLQTSDIKTQYPNSIKSSVSLSDTGSYTIKSGDLSVFPNNSYVNFYFIRANNIKLIDKATNEDANVKIINHVSSLRMILN